MKRLSLVTVTGMLFALPALAAEPAETPRAEARATAQLKAEEARAKAAVGSALEAEEGTQATPPELPAQASEQARKAHAETAFGKKGAEQRAAAKEAAERGKQAAQSARETAATRASERGAGAAKGTEGESRAAAGRARAAEAGSTSGITVPGRDNVPATPPTTGRR